MLDVKLKSIGMLREVGRSIEKCSGLRKTPHQGI